MPEHNWLPRDEDEFAEAMQSRTEELFRIHDLSVDEVV